MNRTERRDRQIQELIDEFRSLVRLYDRVKPFKKTGQLELHRHTIAIRRQHSSSADALADSEFIESLYATLRAWGVGVRASILVPVDRFGENLRDWAGTFEELDTVTIDDPNLDHDAVADLLWQLISGIDIVENHAKLVALSKTIHHILPDLLPPIDRAYTQVFFLWNQLDFQNEQERVFRSMFQGFATIASHVEPTQYVGSGWWTSRTKVIDNALVAFVRNRKLTEDSPVLHALIAPEPTNVTKNYTTEELYEKLEEFKSELEAAGLKQNTVQTYEGRSRTFVDWLAGRYRPRGPNSGAE